MIPNTMGVLDTGFQCLLDQKKPIQACLIHPKASIFVVLFLLGASYRENFNKLIE